MATLVISLIPSCNLYMLSLVVVGIVVVVIEVVVIVVVVVVVVVGGNTMLFIQSLLGYTRIYTCGVTSKYVLGRFY